MHGPHHSAEKSTSTGVSVCINSENVGILLLDFFDSLYKILFKKQIFNINHSYKSYINIYLSKNNVLIEIPINNKAKIFFNNCWGISWANFAPKYPLITNAKAKIKEDLISTLPAL